MVDLNTLPLPDLYQELSRGGLVHRLLELARDEDLGPAAGGGRGDITSDVCVPQDAVGQARLVARAPGVIAGFAAAPDLLRVFAPRATIEPRIADGDEVAAGATLGVISGPVREILGAERTLLNLLSRLSGVATLTRRFVRAVGEAEGLDGPPRARLYDTRKTTPGLRMLEKYAVRCGGGLCHRLGLHDAVLIKDNHLAHVPGGELAARITAAARAARSLRGAGGLRFVEVEVDSLEQFDRVLEVERGLLDVVLLDNMTLDGLREAVRRRDSARSPLQLEASGGVRLETVGAIARTGVDRISAGAVTHSAVALDIALDAT